MKQSFWVKRDNVLRQSLLSFLLVFGLVSCVPGTENPLTDFFGNPTPQATEGEVSELVPTEAITEETTNGPLVVEVVEIPVEQIDQLEQELVAAQEENQGEETILRVVTLDDSSENTTEVTEEAATIEVESTTATTTEAESDAVGSTEPEATTEAVSTTETEVTTEPESTTETEATSDTTTSSFTTVPSSAQNSEGNDGARAEDPETIIIEYTNVDSLQEDASLSNFFAAGPHVLLAMRDEDEMIGIATLAPDGTLSLRTPDVLEHSRPADETFVGCLDVTRETPFGSEVYGGIAFFESITVPGLILTPVLDINGDNSYIPAVNYVRLTDPLLVAGTCFEIENAIESVQASFVPGWNRLLRELDWRDIAQGNTQAQNSNVQKTLWSVNNNSETVVKWLYSRP